MGIQDKYSTYLDFNSIDHLLDLFKQTSELINLKVNGEKVSNKIINYTLNSNFNSLGNLMKMIGFNDYKEIKDEPLMNLLAISDKFPELGLRNRLVPKLLADNNVEFLIKFNLIEPINFNDLSNEIEELQKSLCLKGRFGEYEVLASITGHSISELTANAIFNEYFLKIKMPYLLDEFIRLTGFKPIDSLIITAQEEGLKSKIIQEEHIPDFGLRQGGTNYYIKSSVIDWLSCLNKLLPLADDKVMNLYKGVMNVYVSEEKNKIINLKKIKDGFNFTPDSGFFSKFSNSLCTVNRMHLFKDLVNEFNLEYDQAFYDEVYTYMFSYADNRCSDDFNKAVSCVKELSSFSGNPYTASLQAFFKEQLLKGNLELVMKLSDTLDVTPVFDYDLQPVYVKVLSEVLLGSVRTTNCFECLNNYLKKIDWLVNKSNQPIEPGSYLAAKKESLISTSYFGLLCDLMLALDKYSGLKTDYKQVFSKD